MRKRTAKEKEARRNWLLASCEATRQQCNKLTDEERRHYRDLALDIIHGHDAKTSARSR
jgi:hypothetical protein